MEECRGKWTCRLGGLEQIAALCLYLRFESIIKLALERIHLLIKQSNDATKLSLILLLHLINEISPSVV